MGNALSQNFLGPENLHLEVLSGTRMWIFTSDQNCSRQSSSTCYLHLDLDRPNFVSQWLGVARAARIDPLNRLLYLFNDNLTIQHLTGLLLNMITLCAASVNSCKT